MGRWSERQNEEKSISFARHGDVMGYTYCCRLSSALSAFPSFRSGYRVRTGDLYGVLDLSDLYRMLLAYRFRCFFRLG